MPQMSGDHDTKRPLEAGDVRARLAGQKGEEYWRSLEELAGSEEFEEMLHREFPREAAVWESEVDRRSFLKLMAASLALAGLSACTPKPDESMFPYVREPENITPGKPLFFATAMTLGGYATGVLVKSTMGRPVKVEGNPEHPASLGATDVFAQSAILTLYDPERSQVILRQGRYGMWSNFLSEMEVQRETQRSLNGAGLRILTGSVTSPTLGDQLQALLRQFPLAKWHQYEPVMNDAAREGSQAASAGGAARETLFHFDKADVVLSFESDFIGNGPASIPYGRAFIKRRKPAGRKTAMNRLYVIESTPTLTGGMADHRLPVQSRAVLAYAQAVAQRLGIGKAPPSGGGAGGTVAQEHEQWLDAVVRDLQAHAGTSIVLAGEYQPRELHELVHAINERLGNTGKTITAIPSAQVRPVNQIDSLRELVTDLRAGTVDLLVMLGCNPVYDAPVDLEFREALLKARRSVHLGLYADETAFNCHWHIPEAHFLESWGDARAFDGTVTLIQPLIAPLFGGRTAHEILAVFAGGEQAQSGRDIVRTYWKNRFRGGAPEFETYWRTSLERGILDTSGMSPENAATDGGGGGTPKISTPPQRGKESGGLEIIFRPDPTIWDGRFANNGWLQELPKPLTKITWDNAALISPKTAEALGVASEDLVELTYRGRSLRAPVWILPGQAEHSVTLHLGYGRTRSGRIGDGTGFNANLLRTSDAPWFGDGLEVRKVEGKYRLSVTQHHSLMEGRNLVRTATLEEYRANPYFAQEMIEEPAEEETLYPQYPYDGYKWGMAIDVNACIGCGACTIACQAENNIPIVGKSGVARGREMHWIRIDRYYSGSPANPATYFQPVPCMHCEHAPCELVCPVNATVHDNEGLNVMVYNRCIGTRYCSNNCPYKVRRFNFLEYSGTERGVVAMARNPDVTVRSRGVMEKCTYCVQRISDARIEAKKENRLVRDGELVTACQQVCPTDAIIFGDINDNNSKVRALKRDARNYGLLADLNTRPRTTYLARVRNPNPEISEEEST